MGFAKHFPYESAHDVFREHALLSGFENDGQRDFNIGGLGELDAAGYAALAPVQWPVPVVGHPGTERLFADGRFFTDSARANFIPIVPQAPTNAPSSAFPLVLNTGRVRDQWHTMTRTAKSARLNAHSPEPYVEMCPDDALALGIEDGALARLESPYGSMLARAKLSTAQRAGMVFVPIHWNDQTARQARLGALVNAVTDPVSGQPELKHTPVRVLPYEPHWHGFALSRRQLAFTDASYCVTVKGERFWRYELAGESPAEDWKRWARDILCAPQADGRAEWLEYLDASHGHYHGVRLFTRADGSTTLESCLFIGPTAELPPRSWLAGLMVKPSITSLERTNLLAGVAPRGEVETGPAVCACFGVDANTIRRAIRERSLVSVEAIGQACRAGTNCGSCIPELKSLLHETHDDRHAA
jgi:assimilatory nitrate reductase catalytic subunit